MSAYQHWKVTKINVKHNPLTTWSNGSADSNPLQMAAARGKWRQWEGPICPSQFFFQLWENGDAKLIKPILHLATLLAFVEVGISNPRQCSGGVVDATPHEFFWAGRYTVSSIVLKLSIAYGASFAQLSVKKNLVGSGQVTKLWRDKWNNLRQDFNEFVSKRNLAWSDFLQWG